MIRVLVQTSRPIGWLISPILFCLGFTYAGGNFGVLPVVQIFLLSFPYCLFLYGINDIYDYESDRLNPSKESFEGGALKPKYHGLVRNSSYAIIGLIFLSSLLTVDLTNIVGTIALLFFSYFYSSPPFRFKTRPFLDTLSNGFIYFLAPFIIGYSHNGSILEIPFKIYAITLSVMAVHVFGSIRDYGIDKKLGEKTIGVFLGKRMAALVSGLLFLSTLLLADLNTEVLNYSLVFSTIPPLIIFIYPSEELAFKLFRVYYAVFLVASLAYLWKYGEVLAKSVW